MQNERSSGESVAKNSRSKVWKAKNKFLSGYRNTALVAYPKNTSYCHIAFAAEILKGSALSYGSLQLSWSAR